MGWLTPIEVMASGVTHCRDFYSRYLNTFMALYGIFFCVSHYPNTIKICFILEATTYHLFIFYSNHINMNSRYLDKLIYLFKYA